jgi:hypothetical protein
LGEEDCDEKSYSMKRNDDHDRDRKTHEDNEKREEERKKGKGTKNNLMDGHEIRLNELDWIALN